VFMPNSPRLLTIHSPHHPLGLMEAATLFMNLKVCVCGDRGLFMSKSKSISNIRKRFILKITVLLTADLFPQKYKSPNEQRAFAPA
jgi:hypothetical protein